MALVDVPRETGAPMAAREPRFTRAVVRQYLQLRRWLTLYDHTILPIPRMYDYEEDSLQSILPEELILEVLMRATPQAVSIAACTCRQLRRISHNQAIWRQACLQVFRWMGQAETVACCVREHRCCWWTMWVQHPHLRIDGIYVSRNTYIKPGVAAWSWNPPVHIVCYYRYLRIYADGNFLYRTSPHTLMKIGPTLVGRKSRVKIGMCYGQWMMDGADVTTCMSYDYAHNNSRSSQIVSCLKLRSTIEGANNRLDFVSLAGSYRSETPIDEDDSEMRVNYSRGMAPYVFVPFHEMATSFMNDPVEVMDFLIT